MQYNKAQNSLIIKETNTFLNIPYFDYFKVNTEWIIIQNTNNIKNNIYNTKVQVYMYIEFIKSTFLQRTIESQTKAELMEVTSKW